MRSFSVNPLFRASLLTAFWSELESTFIRVLAIIDTETQRLLSVQRIFATGNENALHEPHAVSFHPARNMSRVNRSIQFMFDESRSVP
jgi:hypothetical protein